MINIKDDLKDFWYKIGDRIQALRRQRHISQAKLAEILDISVKHMSEIERGVAGVSLDKLVQLCFILNTDLNYIVLGIDSDYIKNLKIPMYVIEMFLNKGEAELAKIDEFFLSLRNIMKS